MAQHDPEAAEMAKLAAINAPLWAKFQQRVSTIKDHPMFRDIMTAKPPEILGAGQSGSGSQDPFDADKCKVALEKTNTYKCAHTRCHWKLLSVEARVHTSMHMQADQ